MASVESSGSTGTIAFFLALWFRPMLFGIAIFVACLLGVLTRPIGHLAMIWPANAVMLGLLIRFRGSNLISVWMSAIAAYLAADLLVGTELEQALLLDATNLCGVGAGYCVTRFLPADALRMREPASVLFLVVVATVAAGVAGLVGTLVGPILLGLDALSAWVFWFATELVNYIALLPVILSAPNLQRRRCDLRRPGRHAFWLAGLPGLSLAVSCALAVTIGGPGAVAIVAPALVWCGLAYSVFVASLLSLLINYWSQIFLSTTYIHHSAGVFDEREIVALRLIALMIALAPLILSSVMRGRDELLSKLSLARRRVDMAMDAGGIVATWDLHLARREVVVEGRVISLLGLTDRAQAGISLRDINRRIHPDDRKGVHQALRVAIATDTEYHCRYRMLTASGGARWFAAFGKLFQDKRNAASRLVGILVDVHDEAEAVEALEQSNGRFNIVSESIPQIVWSTDARGRHDYFNRRWTEFTGIEPHNITPDTWRYLVHPEDTVRVNEAWEKCLATGGTYALDYRFRYKDGSYRWLKVLAQPLRNLEGTITRWYGTSTDIHDAKQLEAERELVAHELDHRIGNLFALVNSLVSLTEHEAQDVKSATKELRGRLSALYDAHTLIRRNQDDVSVTIAQLLQQLLTPYDNGNGNITIAGDDLPVAASVATPIALIFHEMATNAVKYGALGDSKGQLSIELIIAGEHYCVTWRELARPQVKSGQGTGLGSRLLSALVEGQLRGRFMRSITEDGIIIHIDLPLASLTAPPIRS